MISVKEAAQNALVFARDLLGDKRTDSILLEEIELSGNRKEWLVTISVPAIRVPANGLALLSPGAAGVVPEPRDCKIIHLAATDGLPMSMKIREL